MYVQKCDVIVKSFLSLVQCACVCEGNTLGPNFLLPQWYIRSASAEAEKKRGGCRDGVEVQVREEEGLAFQYPERITGRALDGWSPQSYTGLRDGCIKSRREG